MTSVYEIKANELIEKLAEQLKDIKEINNLQFIVFF